MVLPPTILYPMVELTIFEAFYTTPGFQNQLTFFSVTIYQSYYGVSLDQTQHIYSNI